MEPRSLAEMHNRPTRYEIVATDGARSIRLGFAVQINKGRLLDMARAQGAAIIAMLNGWNGKPTYSHGNGWQFGPVRVGKSGATERDIAAQMLNR